MITVNPKEEVAVKNATNESAYVKEATTITILNSLESFFRKNDNEGFCTTIELLKLEIPELLKFRNTQTEPFFLCYKNLEKNYDIVSKNVEANREKLKQTKGNFKPVHLNLGKMLPVEMFSKMRMVFVTHMQAKN